MTDDSSECYCPMCGLELTQEDSIEWETDEGEWEEEKVYYCQNCGKMSETTIERIKDYVDDCQVTVSKCDLCGHCWISQTPEEMSNCPQCSNIEKKDLLHGKVISARVIDVVERLGSPEKLWDEIVKKAEVKQG
jgi:hypothetical protein